MLRRLEAYAKAGAEMLFPEALADEDEMAYVAARLPAPAMANMADGGSTRILPASRLEEIGYAGAIFPAMTALASAAASQKALARLKASGTSVHDDVPLYPFDDFCSLIGFDDVYAFDARFAHIHNKSQG
jgi:2-methylisocitrate lyase-like PEP mutase family enzyme